MAATFPNGRAKFPWHNEPKERFCTLLAGAFRFTDGEAKRYRSPEIAGRGEPAFRGTDVTVRPWPEIRLDALYPLFL